MHQRLPRTTTPRQTIPFVYDAYRRLIRELGAIDGLSSAVMLSTRSLAEVAGKDKWRQRAIVERRAKRYEINTRFVDFETLEVRSAQLLLVGIYQQAEAFVDGLRRERLQMGREWRNARKGKTKYHHLMACLGEGLTINIERVGTERWELFDYYRRLRNSFAHSSSRRAELDSWYAEVQSYRALVLREYYLDAPNPVDRLTYHDYLLATRVVKYLATDWCRLAEPTADDIISLLKSQVVDRGAGFGAIVANRGDEHRTKRGLRGWLRQDYGYEIGRYPNIEEVALAWIKALPNKHDRRADKKSLSEFLSPPCAVTALSEIADAE